MFDASPAVRNKKLLPSVGVIFPGCLPASDVEVDVLPSRPPRPVRTKRRNRMTPELLNETRAFGGALFTRRVLLTSIGMHDSPVPSTGFTLLLAVSSDWQLVLR